MVDSLSRRFDCDVVLGNDLQIAAIAEARHGVTSEGLCGNLSFLEWGWGSGIGGCLVRREQGTERFYPTEMGHVMVDPSSEWTCAGCKRAGHMEAICGGNNLLRRFGVTSFRDIRPDMWEDVLADLIVGFESILSVNDVPLVVATGGVINRHRWMLERLQTHFDQPRFGSPTFRMSQFGADAGSQGAHLLLAA